MRLPSQSCVQSDAHSNFTSAFEPRASVWNARYPRAFLCVFTALILGLASVLSSAAPGKDQPKLILFLTADGFRTDYIEWYSPPTLKQLIADGVRVLHVTNVFPTVTAPNMTALVCGAWPRTTAIAGNSQYVAEKDKVVERPRDLKATTIAETLSKAGWTTAAVNHFMLENRGTQTYVEAGYDESEKTTDAILKLLKEKHPSFIATIYGATDHAGHRFGPHSDEVREAVLGIDTAIARLIKGLKDLGLYDQTVIAFTADHGMSGYDEKPISADPAKSLEKSGFKVATSSKAVNDDTQIVMISAGVRMIWFRKNVSEKQKAVALNCLREIKGTELLERAQLDDLGCHNNRSGDVILSPLPGYTITHAGDKGGQHGRFAERNPVMFFHGPGFAKNKTIPGARNIDVVPTLLHLAAVPPAPTVEGKVILDVLSD